LTKHYCPVNKFKPQSKAALTHQLKMTGRASKGLKE